MSRIALNGNPLGTGTVTIASPNTNSDRTVTLPDASGTLITNSGTEAVSVASLTDSGNLNFTGTGNRITGDFSNGTVANRVLFQTSTTNGNTTIAAIPNGTSVIAGFQSWANAADLTNSSYSFMSTVGGNDFRISTDRTGAGTYLPMTFYTGGSERMRVTTAGDVGIGTSTPLTKFTVSGGYISQTDGTVRTYLGADGSGGSLVGTTTNQYFRFITNDVERMRITSAGDVGIGTGSSVNARLNVISSPGTTQIRWSDGTNGTGWLDTVSGATRIWSNVALAFGSGSETFTERARIDSSGRLLVGSSSSVSSSGVFQAVQATSTGNAVISADAQSSSYAYNIAYLNTSTVAGTGFYFISCTSGNYGAFQFRVRGDGTIYAQNTTVQSVSDVRVKENIRDSEDGLQVVLGLQPRRFDFKQGFGNDRKNVLGFIAQEIETVFPDAVDITPVDPDHDGPEEPYKSVGPGALIPVLVKAIQEQQAIIQELTARVQALEAKA